MGITLFLSYTQ